MDEAKDDETDGSISSHMYICAATEIQGNN